MVPKASSSPSLPAQLCTSCSEQPPSFCGAGGNSFQGREQKNFLTSSGKKQHRPHPRALSYEERVTPRPAGPRARESQLEELEFLSLRSHILQGWFAAARQSRWSLSGLPAPGFGGRAPAPEHIQEAAAGLQRGCWSFGAAEPEMQQSRTQAASPADPEPSGDACFDSHSIFSQPGWHEAAGADGRCLCWQNKAVPTATPPEAAGTLPAPCHAQESGSLWLLGSKAKRAGARSACQLLVRSELAALCCDSLITPCSGRKLRSLHPTSLRVLLTAVLNKGFPADVQGSGGKLGVQGEGWQRGLCFGAGIKPKRAQQGQGAPNAGPVTKQHLSVLKAPRNSHVLLNHSRITSSKAQPPGITARSQRRAGILHRHPAGQGH